MRLVDPQALVPVPSLWVRAVLYVSLGLIPLTAISFYARLYGVVAERMEPIASQMGVTSPEESAVAALRRDYGAHDWTLPVCLEPLCLPDCPASMNDRLFPDGPPMFRPSNVPASVTLTVRSRGAFEPPTLSMRRMLFGP